MSRNLPITETLQALGFERHPDNPQWWRKVHDEAGPLWYCVTVKLDDLDVTVSGTAAGHREGSKLRQKIRPFLERH